jgi:hypothetical protein
MKPELAHDLFGSYPHPTLDQPESLGETVGLALLFSRRMSPKLSSRLMNWYMIDWARSVENTNFTPDKMWWYQILCIHPDHEIEKVPHAGN